MSLLSLLFIHVHSFLETVKAKLSFKLDHFPLFPVLVLNKTVDWKFKTPSNSYIGFNRRSRVSLKSKLMCENFKHGIGSF